MTIEQENIQLQYEIAALESEILMHELFIDDDEDDELALESVGSKLADMGSKIIEGIKKIFLFIPKLIMKAVNKIKNSKAVTKVRANSSLPDELKDLPADKLNNIKRLRIEILKLKGDLMTYGENEINTAIKLSQQLNSALSAVANNLKTTKGAHDTVNNKIEYGEANIKRLRTKIEELKQNRKSTGKIEELNKKLDELREVCDDSTIFAYSVPEYKGTNNAEKYKNEIDNNCTQYLNATKNLDELIKHPKTVSGALKNVAAKVSDSYSAKYEANKENNQAVQLSKIYLEGGQFLQTVATDYVNICDAVFKVYPLPEGAQTKEERTQKFKEDDENDKNNKKSSDPNSISNPKGELNFDSKKGCWVYARSYTDAANKIMYVTYDFEKSTDAGVKPGVSQELENKMSSTIEKQKKLKH